jgi:hypothetical protein
MPLEKAILKVVSGDPLSDPSAKDIKFMFNPTEMSFTRSSSWDYDSGARGHGLLPKVNFSGINPYSLSLNKLVFDTYETKGQDPTGKNLTDIIENIKKGVSGPDGENKRPPIYILSWGGIEYFYCVMTKLTYTFTMFLPNGTPVRALVDIDLQEVDATNLPGTKGKGTTSTKSRQGGPSPLKKPNASTSGSRSKRGSTPKSGSKSVINKNNAGPKKKK